MEKFFFLVMVTCYPYASFILSAFFFPIYLGGFLPLLQWTGFYAICAVFWFLLIKFNIALVFCAKTSKLSTHFSCSIAISKVSLNNCQTQPPYPLLQTLYFTYFIFVAHIRSRHFNLLNLYLKHFIDHNYLLN